MTRENLNDLAAFVAIATARSFTRAAAQLGVSPSALSHSMRGLEERLGVRLLARTTRSVSPTEAGERLLLSIGPHLQGIDEQVAALSALRDKPAGTIRITASEHAAVTLLYPMIRELAPQYPDLNVEVSLDNAFADIVAGRYDAGIRLGEQVERDMVAVRIGPDMRMAIVGTPGYFDRYGTPLIPQDLTRHNCIGMRLPTHGNLLAWEFEKAGDEITVRVEGQLTFNATTLGLRAALDGLGLGYCPEDLVSEAVAAGRLVRVLEDWCEPFPGYHLYYPSRRQQSPGFRCSSMLCATAEARAHRQYGLGSTQARRTAHLLWSRSSFAVKTSATAIRCRPANVRNGSKADTRSERHRRHSQVPSRSRSHSPSARRKVASPLSAENARAGQDDVFLISRTSGG